MSLFNRLTTGEAYVTLRLRWSYLGPDELFLITIHKHYWIRFGRSLDAEPVLRLCRQVMTPI